MLDVLASMCNYTKMHKSVIISLKVSSKEETINLTITECHEISQNSENYL